MDLVQPSQTPGSVTRTQRTADGSTAAWPDTHSDHPDHQKRPAPSTGLAL